MSRKNTKLVSAALAAVAVSAGLLLVVGRPNASASSEPVANPAAAARADAAAPFERGKIVGWPGGNATIYSTLGFFGDPQIVAVGAVHLDGSFAVRLPKAPPVDLLVSQSDGGGAQCSTIRSTVPNVLSNFTGDDLIFQHGKEIGATHSGSSFGIASFTGFADGDTRTGFVYASHATKWSGFCDRTITFGDFTADFRQNVNVSLQRGWNLIKATFSLPAAGKVVADLTNGGNPAEKWYFFKQHSAN